MDQEILVVEAMALTGYSRQHVYGLAKAGDIVSRKLGWQYLINRQSLLDYAKRQGHKLPLLADKLKKD